MTASWNAQLRVKKLNTFFAPEQAVTTIEQDKKEEQQEKGG